MEHGFADLLNDAFSDTSLPCYQEGELDFESLNLQEDDGNGNSTEEFERLPALTEVDEDDDPVEDKDTRCVSMGMSEKEPRCSRSGFPQGEDCGDIVDLRGQEVEDECEIGVHDEALVDDEDAGGLSSSPDRSEMIGLRRGFVAGDQKVIGENTGSGEQTRGLGKEREPSAQWAVECPRGDGPLTGSDLGGEEKEEDLRGLKDGRSLSELPSFKIEAGEEERLGYMNTDSDTDSDTYADADVDIDADVDAVADREMVIEIVTDMAPGAEDAAGSAADADADEQVGGFAEERCYSAREESLEDFLQVLPKDPFSGELKDFSETDCGSIGEGYAEYPSDEEEYKDKEEKAKRKFRRGSGQHSGTGSPHTGAELSGWELMEGGAEEDWRKGGHKESDDVGLGQEEEIEVLDSCEGDAEVQNNGSKPGSEGAQGKCSLDWTEDPENNAGDAFSEGKEDDDGYDEITHKMKWTGEEWDSGREDDVRQEESSADEEGSSSCSDSEPWPHRAGHPPTPRGLSAGPLCPQAGSQSQAGCTTHGHRVPRPNEAEFANEEEVEEEEEEEEVEAEEDEEGERNWEQERERIQAFYRYYNDEEEDDDVRREGQGHSSRKHMVRFCLDPLPLQRDSDSSDTDRFSSSSAGAEDSDSAVTYPGTSAVTSAGTCPGTSAVTSVGTCPGNRAVTSAVYRVVSCPVTSAVTSAGTCPGTRAVTSAVYRAVTCPVTSAVTGAGTSTVTRDIAGAGTWMPMRTEGSNIESCREILSLLLQESQVTQAELKKLSVKLRAHQGSRVLSVLRAALRMSLVSVLGITMFWWATDQLDWTGLDWNT